MDGEPMFAKPETDVVAGRMLQLAEVWEKGIFKPNGDNDVLSVAIESKEHAGYVRDVSSKLTNKDRF